MWTDIDYMDLRRTFTLDPERFSPALMTDFVDTLHQRDQHYVAMVDPAVWSGGPNPARDKGKAYDVFMKAANGSEYGSVVWPGPTFFPDWFHPNATTFWNEQFFDFFDGVNGPDIDALWVSTIYPL